MTGLLVGLSAVGIWSLHATVVALTVRSTSSFDLTIMAFALSWVFLLVIHGIRGTPLRRYSRVLGPWLCIKLLISGTVLMLYYFCLYYGFTVAPVIDVYVIHLLWPIFAALFVQLFLRHGWEKLTTREWLLMGLAFAGAAMIVIANATRTAGPVHYLGYGLAILSAISGGLYLPALLAGADRIKALGAGEYDSFTYPYTWLVTGGLLSLLIYLAFGGHTIEIGAAALPGVLYLGLAVFVIAEMAWVYGFRVRRSASIASVAYFTPVFSAVLLHVVANEPVSPWAALGLAAIVVANATIHIAPRGARQIH